MSKEVTFKLDLTRSEVDQLARWHKECEERCAGMREYEMAQEHKDRRYLFDGTKHTGKYMGMSDPAEGKTTVIHSNGAISGPAPLTQGLDLGSGGYGK